MLGRGSSRRLRGLPGGLSEAWEALRCTSSSAAAEAGRGHAAAAAAAEAAGGGGSAEAILGSGNAPERVAKVLAHSFHK